MTSKIKYERLSKHKFMRGMGDLPDQTCELCGHDPHDIIHQPLFASEKQAHCVLRLSFDETLALVNTLAHLRDNEVSDEDKLIAQQMLTTIEQGLT